MHVVEAYTVEQLILLELKGEETWVSLEVAAVGNLVSAHVNSGEAGLGDVGKFSQLVVAQIDRLKLSGKYKVQIKLCNLLVGIGDVKRILRGKQSIQLYLMKRLE